VEVGNPSLIAGRSPENDNAGERVISGGQRAVPDQIQNLGFDFYLPTVGR
jgi:NAD dependent epimerase/dehydratase family enzyme